MSVVIVLGVLIRKGVTRLMARLLCLQIDVRYRVPTVQLDKAA